MLCMSAVDDVELKLTSSEYHCGSDSEPISTIYGHNTVRAKHAAEPRIFSTIRRQHTFSSSAPAGKTLPHIRI